jgi:hypothetical protein
MVTVAFQVALGLIHIAVPSKSPMWKAGRATVGVLVGVDVGVKVDTEFGVFVGVNVAEAVGVLV